MQFATVEGIPYYPEATDRTGPKISSMKYNDSALFVVAIFEKIPQFYIPMSDVRSIRILLT